MAASAPLFACTNCHTRHRFEELSKSEQLCGKCRRQHPLVSCSYCRLEFHLVKKTDTDPVCETCAHNVQLYGMPVNCKYCSIRAAFKDSKCGRCTSSEQKYGVPVRCQQCKLKCAFKKSSRSLEKVDGKVLCLLCTLAYKRLKHRGRKRSKHHNPKELENHKKRRSKMEENTEKATNSVTSRLIAAESAGQQSASNSPLLSGLYGSQDVEAPDLSLVDHMTELTQLREEIESMKKLTQLKDKHLLEKDKKIHELQANQWEKEKELRQKIQTIQKESSEKIEQLQVENRSLRKQISQATKNSKLLKQEKKERDREKEKEKVAIEKNQELDPLSA